MKAFPWFISMTVHGIVLLLGGLAFHQAVVGVSQARNSVEVNLVAAPSNSAPAPSAQPSAESPTLPPIAMPLPPAAEITPPLPSFEPMPAPKLVLPPLPTLSAPASSRPAKQAQEHNHSSASNTGKESITAQSVAGAIVDEEPDYLSNPPPIYPEAARDNDQEGLVTLDVIVDTQGQVESAKVSSSSGYYLLDDAALKAVWHYRFRPALLGSIKVKSHVKVPIRFRLDQ